MIIRSKSCESLIVNRTSAPDVQLINAGIKEYKKQKCMQTWNPLKRRLRTCTLVKNKCPHFPYQPRNSQGKDGACNYPSNPYFWCGWNKTLNFAWMVPLSTKLVPVF